MNSLQFGEEEGKKNKSNIMEGKRKHQQSYFISLYDSFCNWVEMCIKRRKVFFFFFTIWKSNMKYNVCIFVLKITEFNHNNHKFFTFNYCGDGRKNFIFLLKIIRTEDFCGEWERRVFSVSSWIFLRIKTQFMWFFSYRNLFECGFFGEDGID